MSRAAGRNPSAGSHAVDPDDELLHTPGPEPLWNESYYLDFVTDEDAVAGYARIGRYPNLGVTWWTAALVGAGRPVVVSVAHHLPVAGGTGLVLGSDGVDLRGALEIPLEMMSLRGTAPARGHDRPEAVYRGEPGAPHSIALDLSWATDGVPYHYDLTSRYEVHCLVTGEVTIGDERLVVSGQGQRDHSWGVRDWWAFGWCWAAARLDDGTRVHLADIRIPGQRLGFGYVQPGDGAVLPVASLDVTETLGPEGLPDVGRATVEPGSLDLRIDPVAFGPVVLEAPDGRVSRFPRALARFAAADGRSGLGWIEWNQPDGSEGPESAR
jgi:hypothetical protein